jgi:hypothetical protein
MALNGTWIETKNVTFSMIGFAALSFLCKLYLLGV